MRLADAPARADNSPAMNTAIEVRELTKIYRTYQKDPGFFGARVGEKDLTGAVAAVTSYKTAQAVFAPVGSAKRLTPGAGDPRFTLPLQPKQVTG